MKIHPYSKSELAQAYAPEITSQAALNRLAAWIRLNRRSRKRCDRPATTRNNGSSPPGRWH